MTKSVKLSVSVPSVQWELMRRKYPEMGDSAIVQMLLERDITDEDYDLLTRDDLLKLLKGDK